MTRCYRFIKSQVLEKDVGRTGKVAFDDNGDRLYSEYDIVNIQDHGPVEVGQFFYVKVTFIRMSNLT